MPENVKPQYVYDSENKTVFIRSSRRYAVLTAIAVAALLAALIASTASAQFRPCVWPNTCGRTV